MKWPSFAAWSPLRLPVQASGKAVLAVSGALLAAALSWALALWAESGASAAARTLAQAQAALRVSEAELAEARELAAALELARPRWQALAAAGVLDAPAPAQWSRAIERLLQRRANAASAPLQFEAQPPAADPSMLALVLNVLELPLELRHEGHLPPLIDAIEALPGAFVRTAGCRLSRQAGARDKALLARCRLHWITVDAAGDAEP